MNKKFNYEAPEIEVIKFSSADAVFTSTEKEWSDENTQEGGWVCY